MTENYAQINKTVAGMEDGNVIQPLPPTPLFDDLTAEDAASLQTPLADSIEVWIRRIRHRFKEPGYRLGRLCGRDEKPADRRILQDCTTTTCANKPKKT